MKTLSLISSSLTVLGLFVAVNVYAMAPLPPVIKGFCQLAFAGNIARQGQAFNATGKPEKGIPSRRILSYEIGKHDAYLWYEHGSPRYHQHLVKFSSTPPYEVEASYVFDRTQDKTIQQLIQDRRFLASHLINHCGL